MNMFIQVLLFFVAFLENARGYELKQLIVLSRHNIRTPVVNTTILQYFSPERWPSWNGNPGELTPKGYLLEHYMGRYFSDWMIQEKLLDNCPKDQVFVYADNVNRMIETAEAFVEGAFGDCVDVYHKDTEDPVFQLIIKNASAEFKQEAFNEMQKKLKSINLKEAMLQLDRIVDFGNSTFCKIEDVCDLSEYENEIVLEVNSAPGIEGGLVIGYSLVDAFLMAYYDGMPTENVAWGQIQTIKQWKSLLSILNTYINVCYGTKVLDKDIASGLLKYLTNLVNNGKKKFYLLVGHDTNISSLMSSLRFKDYDLRKQFEKTPIGGKLVFQKWYDEKKDQDFLKVNYVYQSFKAIRDGVKASLQNPPQWDTLEMENCAVDEHGLCLWDDFVRVLNKI